MQYPQVPEAMGKALSIIEGSLLEWENGINPAKQDSGGSREANWLSSFFGRARHLVQLDQHQDESTEEADDLSMPTMPKRSLPLLRDLPLDPSTLCKLTCSFVKLRARHPCIDAGDRLGKTALRLLTSRNGRLMRECPMHDLIRLCDAVARSGRSGMPIAGRERTSNFVRRFLHYFNEMPSDEPLRISSHEVSTLVWSLGELGVRYNPDKAEASTAYRRLQLVSEIPRLSTDQLQELPNVSVSRLVSFAESIIFSLHRRPNPRRSPHRFNFVES